MKLFDVHNHIQDDRLSSDLAGVMQRAQLLGVCRMGVKGCHEGDWLRVAQIAKNYSFCEIAFGLHPWFVTNRSEQWIDRLNDLLQQYPNASVGEIGIDHAIERNDQDQEKVFIDQLVLARQLNRPVSIHCRQAWGRLIELIDQVGVPSGGMLIHCFGGSVEIAKELVKRGAYISFSGSITRPNNRKAERVIKAVPFDRILLETDAPDLMPCNLGEVKALREVGADQRALNEPANILATLKKVAQFRGVSEQEMAAQTYINAKWFYRL